jgi:glycosyltransferase A (GT-A) superfamily protein (DUF2064 family)
VSAADGPAALVLARAPSAGEVKSALAPLLDAERRAALQALLIHRAAAWAAAVAPGAAYVAVEPPRRVRGADEGGVIPSHEDEAAAPERAIPPDGDAAAPGRAIAPYGDAPAAPGPAIPPGGDDAAVAGALDEVRGLLPPGVTAFAQEDAEPAEALAAAIARIGRGPLLVAGVDCPRLGAAHAAAALGDLAAGCDVVVGATLEGGWYLAGLREPRPELLTIAPPGAGGFERVLRRAAARGAEVGMLRHERLLIAPPDASALLADPLLPADLRAALTPSAAA